MQRIEMAAATDGGFGYGEPIDVVVTPGDEIVLLFDGEEADAVAVSIQQCTGNRYVRMGVFYNADEEDISSGPRLSGSQCVRIKANTSAPDSFADEFNKLCAFKNSGPVYLNYDEDTLNSSMTLSTTTGLPTVDPSMIHVVISNSGTTTATVQVAMFSSSYPALSADSSVDRVHTESNQDENTFTVDAEFQAEGSFCDDGVCAVYAYYIEVDEDDSEADLLFATTCQARTGVMVYEGATTLAGLVSDNGGDESDGDNNDDDVETAALGAAAGAAATTASTTPYDLTACTEFPKNTEATYRVYLVLSPDTATASRVGYGLQDQLLYESEEIRVEGDMDHVCPEIITEDSSGAARTLAVAPGAAPAAAAAAAVISGAVALFFGASV